MKNNIIKIRRAFNDHTTEHFSFRCITKADCFPLLNATENLDFNRFLLWDKPESANDLMANVLKLMREDQTDSAVVLSVCEKSTGKWVGLLKWSPYEDTLCIGFWLHPDYWRTMTAYQIVDSSFDLVFRQTNLPHLYSLMNAQNVAPQKIALKKGAELVGHIMVQHEKGHDLPSNVYRVSQQVWKNNTNLFFL